MNKTRQKQPIAGLFLFIYFLFYFLQTTHIDKTNWLFFNPYVNLSLSIFRHTSSSSTFAIPQKPAEMLS